MLRCSANNRTFYRSKTKCSIWLGKMDGNGTFYSSEYDPQFNIEDIREILDKDEEVDNT